MERKKKKDEQSLRWGVRYEGADIHVIVLEGKEVGKGMDDIFKEIRWNQPKFCGKHWRYKNLNLKQVKTLLGASWSNCQKLKIKEKISNMVREKQQVIQNSSPADSWLLNRKNKPENFGVSYSVLKLKTIKAKAKIRTFLQTKIEEICHKQISTIRNAKASCLG